MNSILPNVSFQDYQAIPAWGSSSLRAMRRGPPARVKWERDNPLEVTDAIRIGSAAHSRLLTPELYGEQYVAKPMGMTFASKEGKAWRDAHAGLQIIPAADAATVGDIVQAILDKELVAKTLTDSLRELTLTWTCPSSGELCKARLDWVNAAYLYDLKVSRHAAGGALAFRAYMDGWMHQLAHYRTGCIVLGLEPTVLTGRLVVVSPAAPHYVHCLQVKGDALDLLEMENLETLRAMAECRKSGVWPDTEARWVPVEPPAAALVKLGVLDLGDNSEDAF